MRDLPWSKYPNGPHHNETMAAHNKEFSGLTSTILRELFLGDAEYSAAKRGTNCQLILNFKRVGIWKAHMVIQGPWVSEKTAWHSGLMVQISSMTLT